MRTKIYTIAGTLAFIAGGLLGNKSAQAQAPAITWQKNMGGSNNEAAMSCQQTLDGGYIIGGYTFSSNGDVTGFHPGGTDAWVVKLTSTGTVSWKYAFGGPGSEGVQSIRQTPDGGYIFAGYATANGGDVTGNHGINDVWVVKLDGGGVMQWQKCIGGSLAENAYSIRQTFDGGYILAGFTNSNDGDITLAHGASEALLVKLDGTGNIQWYKTYGGLVEEGAYDVVQTSDSGYFFTGYSYSIDGDCTINHGGQDVWSVKTDKTGAIQWERSMGGTDGDQGLSCAQMSDGTYVVAGVTESNNGNVTTQKGNGDQWVIRFSATGSVLWQKTYGGSQYDEARSVYETAGGGLIVGGYTYSNDTNVSGNHGNGDVWVLKLSASGGIQWQRTYGGSNDEASYCIGKTSDNGYVFVGSNISNDGDLIGNWGMNDLWVAKLAGCTLTAPTIAVASTVLSTTMSYDTYQWKLSGTDIAGATMPTYTATISGDYTVEVTNSSGCPGTSAIQTVTIVPPPTGINDVAGNAIAIYPNPTSGIFHINLPAAMQETLVTVTNLMGQIMSSTTFDAGMQQLSINGNELAAGNYIVTVTSGNEVYKSRVTVIR